MARECVCVCVCMCVCVSVCLCVCGEVAPDETEEMTKKNR